jgi:uncharacterized protein YlxW (UPF0749 family)
MNENLSSEREALAAARTEIGVRVDRITRRLDDAESDETRINAGALPVIGFGIVLSSGRPTSRVCPSG